MSGSCHSHPFIGLASDTMKPIRANGRTLTTRAFGDPKTIQVRQALITYVPEISLI